MGVQVIAGIAAVVVAIIGALIPAFFARDSRKKALDEAELLGKLRAAGVVDGAAVTDLKMVLARRVNRWKERNGVTIYAFFMASTIFMAALLIGSSAALAALNGQDMKNMLAEVLSVLQKLGLWGFAGCGLLLIVTAVCLLIGEVHAWHRARTVRQPTQSAAPAPQGNAQEHQDATGGQDPVIP